jgi:hypothetical protein
MQRVYPEVEIDTAVGMFFNKIRGLNGENVF